jgi:OmcA/MtrC family decaheme c-type cytochrome
MSEIRVLALAAALAFAGVTALVGADGSATPRDVTFARPGLVIKVTGAEIGADGIIRARVKLTDLRGLPLDRLGNETPGAISVSFIAAYIPQGKSTYWAYTTRAQKSPITSITEMQASGDSGGSFEKVADGEYVYTFGTKAPAGFDRNAAHTIGAYGSRNLTDLELGTQYDDDVYHFVPASGQTAAMPRDVIRTASCNKCHNDMGFHGGSRKTMELCILCHSPQTVDPDTGNSVDMAVMTHKIHMGADLPSVQAGKKYTIIGHSQSVHDYSKIHFPADARSCVTCHEQGAAAQAENMFKPNRTACGACHDDVNFETGAGHVDLPQFTDSQCGTCHVRQGELEFDASILGAHTIPRFSKALPGLMLNIMDVANAGAGKNPTITFSAKDKAGNPVSPSQMSRLNFRIAGPSSDYTTMISETALNAQGENGTYHWTTLAPLPSDAEGTFFVSVEGRRDMKLLEGTRKEMTVRDTARNSNFSFSVDGSRMQARRAIVTSEKCNACHGSIAFHGDSRNTVENCVTCHNPTATAGRGAEAVSIDFRLMVHRIHRGHGLTRSYVVGGNNYNEVGYPGDLRNCGACHVNGSEQLPLRADLSPVNDPNGPMNPLWPTAAACTGCHDSTTAASHIQANTNRLGESCATCHGPDAQFAVSRVHRP